MQQPTDQISEDRAPAPTRARPVADRTAAQPLRRRTRAKKPRRGTAATDQEPRMKRQKESMKSLQIIDDFLKESGGLLFTESEDKTVCEIHQNHDKKLISFKKDQIKNILKRKDLNDESFLQVDFLNGPKILLTQSLVGFSPAQCAGLDMKRLPKVVTTLDLLNVIEAIESSVYGQDRYEEKLEDVKLFFESIAVGAETIGFSLAGERLWVEKLLSASPPSGFDKSFFEA